MTPPASESESIEVECPPTLPSGRETTLTSFPPAPSTRPRAPLDPQPPPRKPGKPKGLKFDTGKVRADLLPAGVMVVLDEWLADERATGEWSVIIRALGAWRSAPGDVRVGVIRDLLGTKTEALTEALANVLVLLAPELEGRRSLLPYAGPALEQVAAVLTFGASKYGPNNWQALADFEARYYAGVLRHLFAFGRGEFIDPESGLPHLAHAACGLFFLLSDLVGHDPY